MGDESDQLLSLYWLVRALCLILVLALGSDAVIATGPEEALKPTAFRVGIGSDASYGGTVWAVSYGRTLAGDRQSLLFDSTVLYLSDGKITTEHTVEKVEYLDLALGVRGRARLGGPLLFDVMLGGLVSHVDWAKTFDTREPAANRGWFVGAAIGYGLGLEIGAEFRFRFDHDIHIVNAKDEVGSSLGFLPWRLGVSYAF